MELRELVIRVVGGLEAQIAVNQGQKLPVKMTLKMLFSLFTLQYACEACVRRNH